MDLHFNQSLALGYHSGSQISRVLTEDWMERNMFYPVCGAPVLGHYEANKPFVTFSEMAEQLSVNRSAVQKQIEGFRKKGYLDRRDDGSWHVLAMNSKIE